MPATIGMTTFSLPAGSKIEMLGVKGNLKWKKEGDGFSVTIPAKHRKNPPSVLACVLKVTY